MCRHRNDFKLSNTLQGRITMPVRGCKWSVLPPHRNMVNFAHDQPGASVCVYNAESLHIQLRSRKVHRCLLGAKFLKLFNMHWTLEIYWFG